MIYKIWFVLALANMVINVLMENIMATMGWLACSLAVVCAIQESKAQDKR